MIGRILSGGQTGVDRRRAAPTSAQACSAADHPSMARSADRQATAAAPP